MNGEKALTEAKWSVSQLRGVWRRLLGLALGQAGRSASGLAELAGARVIRLSASSLALWLAARSASGLA
jgi:hypothetical protein